MRIAFLFFGDNMADVESLITEELKDEVYRVIEIALEEKLKELEDRIKKLEMLKAELIEAQNEMKKEMEEIKRLTISDKKTSSEKLAEIEKLVMEISGKVDALIEERKKKKR